MKSKLNRDEDDDGTSITLTLIINADFLEATFDYSFDHITRDQINNFTKALIDNTESKLQFDPGSNQEASIETANGITILSGWGAGGNNPVSHDVKLPNSKCVQAFLDLLLQM